jgi:hypothetical protein
MQKSVQAQYFMTRLELRKSLISNRVCCLGTNGLNRKFLEKRHA